MQEAPGGPEVKHGGSERAAGPQGSNRYRVTPLDPRLTGSYYLILKLFTKTKAFVVVIFRGRGRGNATSP
jgi:hypothetical protein